jgi:hypothetical protein
MKKNMSKLKLSFKLLLFTLIVFSSCKKSEENTVITQPKTTVSIQNGRVKFSSTLELNSTLELLKNKSTKYLNNWEDQVGIKSLRRDTNMSEDLENFHFPELLLTIINHNGEYMVNDTIIWYNKGYKHYIPNKDENQLSKIKQNPALSKIKFPAGATLIPLNEVVKSNVPLNESKVKITSVTMTNGSIDARYQKEFYNDYGNLRKIIFELYHYTEQGPVGYNSYLYTRIKQEYKGKNWAPAGETMEKWIKNLSFRHGYYSQFNGAYIENVGTVSSIPSYGSQTDGSNLSYLISSVPSSSSTSVISVTGNYHARVVDPGNSAGFWDVAASW